MNEFFQINHSDTSTSKRKGMFGSSRLFFAYTVIEFFVYTCFYALSLIGVTSLGISVFMLILPLMLIASGGKACISCLELFKEGWSYERFISILVSLSNPVIFGIATGSISNFMYSYFGAFPGVIISFLPIIFLFIVFGLFLFVRKNNLEK